MVKNISIKSVLVVLEYGYDSLLVFWMGERKETTLEQLQQPRVSLCSVGGHSAASCLVSGQGAFRCPPPLPPTLVLTSGSLQQS